MPDLATTEEVIAPADTGQQQAPEPVDYGEKFEKLPPEKIDQLRGLCSKFSVRDQWARQLEILRATLLRYFGLGKQHVWWNEDAQQYQVGPQGGGLVTGENLNNEPTSQEDFDIFTPYMKSFMATFAQNSAGIRMEPDQPKDARSIRAAAEADKYRRVYDKYNPAKSGQIDIASLLATDGRVVSLTEYVEDGTRFGYEDSDEEQGEGLAVQPVRKPRGQELTSYHGVLETKLPIFVTEMSDFPYAAIYKDHDVCTLKAKHKLFADKISGSPKSDNPNEDLARMARISTAENIAQLSQDSLAYITTEAQWWFRPSAFQELAKEEQAFWIGDEQTPGIFPEGCRVTFCGTTYCGAKAESMDDALNVMHAMPGKGQARPAYLNGLVPIQMEFNDGMNYTSELIKSTIPETWIDIDEASLQAITERGNNWGGYVPFKRPTNEPMPTFFFQTPAGEPPSVLPAWLENLQGPLAQFISSQPPSVWGGNMEDQKTARVYQMARDSAMGLMVIVWVPFKRFKAKIVEQAAVLASKRAQEFSALVPALGRKKNKDETLDINPDILKGGFVCSENSDENFPESYTQKSNKFMQLMEASLQSPTLAALVNHPDNLALAKDLYGLEELEIPDADSRDKQLDEISQMLEEEPVLDQAKMAQATQAAQVVSEDPNAQAPAPIMRSSVPIDPDCDNHKVEAEECLRWLNSPEGQKLKGQPGFINIRLHFLEHKAILDQQAAMQMQQQAALAAAAHPPKPPNGAPGKEAKPNNPQPLNGGQ